MPALRMLIVATGVAMLAGGAATESRAASLTITGSSVVEGTGGNDRHLRFTVTKLGSGPARAQLTTALGGGSAAPGADFRTGTMPVVFDGIDVTETRKTFSVAIVPDAEPEGDETVHVVLRNPDPFTDLPGGQLAATGTIEDDDATGTNPNLGTTHPITPPDPNLGLGPVNPGAGTSPGQDPDPEPGIGVDPISPGDPGAEPGAGAQDPDEDEDDDDDDDEDDD